MKPEDFHLPPNYKIRRDNQHFDDTIKKDQIWQKEVYQKARDLSLGPIDSECILDIGCGDGEKLDMFFSEYETLGLELEPCLSFLRREYPRKRWQKSDFFSPPKQKFDVVVCSDVIEHLFDPNPKDLLRFIQQLDFRVLVISTPDRDLVNRLYGSAKRGFDLGPPINKAHVMEWNQEEFVSLLSDFFEIKEHCISNQIQCTQLAVCAKKT